MRSVIVCIGGIKHVDGIYKLLPDSLRADLRIGLFDSDEQNAKVLSCRTEVKVFGIQEDWLPDNYVWIKSHWRVRLQESCRINKERIVWTIKRFIIAGW